SDSASVLLLFSFYPRYPCSTLFPYTTLFRSSFCTRRGQPASPRAPNCGTGIWPITPVPEQICSRPTRAIRTPTCARFRCFTPSRSEEHTSELQSRFDLVCRLLLEKIKRKHKT